MDDQDPRQIAYATAFIARLRALTAENMRRFQEASEMQKGGKEPSRD